MHLTLQISKLKNTNEIVIDFNIENDKVIDFGEYSNLFSLAAPC